MVSKKIKIKSKDLDDLVFEIEVLLPNDYKPSSTYSILYITDWPGPDRLYYALGGLSNWSDKIKPYIIVGIGFKLDGVKNFSEQRTYNFTPTNVPRYNIKSGEASGGARYFLKFIKDDLIPRIEHKYNVDTKNRCFYGHSFGGLFGVYSLLNNPSLFSKYLLISPVLWWDDFLLIKEFQKLKKLSGVRAMFLAVEEFGEQIMFQMESFTKLKQEIIRLKDGELEFDSMIAIGEDHMTAIPTSMLNGLRFLLKN